MGDLPDEVSDSNQLPAKDLCNSWGTGNPILGKGALGNEKTGRMYYTGGDKRKLVEILQRMLKELEYDIGTSGPDGDGVDGKFQDLTEKAVKKFQEEHKNWDGEPLKVDGLVGPATSDALNRQIVGVWYGHYQTPVELVEDRPIHTATSEFLEKGFSIETGKKQKAKVFLAGFLPDVASQATLTIRLVDNFGDPLKDASYTLEIDDPSFTKVTSVTDETGKLSHAIPGRAKSGRLILDACNFDLTIIDLDPASSMKGALIRLTNLGYLPNLTEVSSQIDDKQFKSALIQFQNDHDVIPCEDLDKSTSEELEDIYGS